MHTETRENLSQHAILLLSCFTNLVDHINKSVKQLPHYPHHPAFNNDVITTKTHIWSHEEGLHIALATAEDVDLFLCVLPVLFFDKIPSFVLSTYEAHLQYTFYLTDQNGIKRADLDHIKLLIIEAKRGMVELTHDHSVLQRPKFASADYWIPLIKFLGPPKDYNTTPFEALHLESKTIGADLTNGCNIEKQVIVEVQRQLAFRMPL